ncbi:MAG TPA: hypothetical protein VGB70_08960 [Allosphingosinicella sp.]
MHHRLFAATAAASLLLALGGCGDSGGNESAAAEPDARQQFAQAADALVAKTGTPGAKAEMPAANDPAVQAFEAQAAKAMTTLGTDALPVDGFDSYQDLCGKAATIVGAYAAAGTSGTAGAAQQQKMEANIDAYMDQMFTPLLFAAHCNAAHMPYLDGEAGGAASDKKAAIGQVRQGMFAQVLGLVQMASDSSFTPERRRRIVELLATDASNFALGMGTQERAQVLQAVTQLRASLPADLQPQADTIRQKIESAKCGAICKTA